jgi:hypothetical protein
LGVLAAEDIVLRDQFLVGGSAAVLGLDSGQDLLGVVVNALAATADLLGRRGERALGADPASGGIGDPDDKRYGTHGDGVSGVYLRSEDPGRVGKSPAELLMGEPHGHWLELLGYTRFARN